jgi:hypothetical protein
MDYVDAYLNGHLHPTDPNIRPFGETVEFTAPAVKVGSKYQILAIDNLRISYHSFELNNNPPLIVTSPISYKRARRSYSDPSFIRVLDFRGDKGNSSNFIVTGAVQGILTKTKEINGVSLYSMPCGLNKGIHKIQITDDLNIEIEFAVHTDSPTSVYTPHHIISCWSVIVVFLLIIV